MAITGKEGEKEKEDDPQVGLCLGHVWVGREELKEGALGVEGQRQDEHNTPQRLRAQENAQCLPPESHFVLLAWV